MPKRAQTIFFLVLLAVALALSFLILRPYLTALFMALVLYIILKPAYNFLLKIFGQRANLAALAGVLLAILAIIVPLAIFSFALFDDAANLYLKITDGGARSGYVLQISETVDKFVGEYIPGVVIDVEGYLQNALAYIVGRLGPFFSSFLDFLMDLLITLFALFFLLRDGPKLKKAVFALSPLPNIQDQNIFDCVEHSIRSVANGSLLIVVIKGILAGAGFAIFGIGNFVLWGSIAGLSSLIPTVGTAVVMIPAVIYLFLIGHQTAAIGLAIWSFIIVGAIDNILAPMLMNRGANIHPLLVLLSVLGGVSLFGPIGFIAGPVAVSLFFSLVRLYPAVLKPV